jgi:hypothetical protein
MKKRKDGAQREDERSSVRQKRCAWHAALDAFDTWMRCVYGRAHTREKKWKWKVSLTTGVTDGFALGISTPERRTGGLTIRTGLRSRERSRLGLDGR